MGTLLCTVVRSAAVVDGSSSRLVPSSTSARRTGTTGSRASGRFGARAPVASAAAAVVPVENVDSAIVGVMGASGSFCHEPAAKDEVSAFAGGGPPALDEGFADDALMAGFGGLTAWLETEVTEVFRGSSIVAVERRRGVFGGGARRVSSSEFFSLSEETKFSFKYTEFRTERRLLFSRSQ